MNQEYPICEILLLDDKSSDKSREIMDTYRQRYPLRIKTYYQEENSGNVFKQWEKGLNLAKGEYVWIAEADDLSSPLFLQQVMRGMASDESVILGYSQSNMIDENGNLMDRNYFCYTDDVDDHIWRADYLISSRQELMEHMTVKNTIPNVSGIVLKKQDFSEGLEAAKHFSVAGDWMFYVSLLKNGGKVFFTSDSLNYHRRHAHSVTSDLNRKKHFEEICRMQDYVCKDLLGIPLTNKAVEYRIQVKKYLQV